MWWAGHVSRMGDRKRWYTVLVEKPEGKGALARLCNRWEYNIKMDITETGLGVVDWINLAQYRCKRRAVVNTVMNFWDAEWVKFLNSLKTIGFLWRNLSHKFIFGYLVDDYARDVWRRIKEKLSLCLTMHQATRKYKWGCSSTYS